MKKLLILLISIFAIAQVLAQDLSADEIVSKNLKAIGQDKLMNAETIKMTGIMSQQGMEFQIIMYQKKPMKMRQELEIQGMSIIMVLEGENGWTINPLMGSMDPVDLPPDAIKSLEHEVRSDPTSSWENPFINWKENGTKIELVGKEDIKGSLTYNLKFTFSDNYVVNYFVDAASFVVLKTKSSESAQGQIYDREIRFSDYKDIDGVLFPAKIDMYMNGQITQVITLEKCEFNVPVDDSIFEKPVPKEN